ncbi:MAG: hypothetical protein U9R74_11695 [Pseudomonadota bacterium]|nr:hypothetical protein [Pseudomonadota bacterium]
MQPIPFIYTAAVAAILSGPLSAAGQPDQLPDLGTAPQQERYQGMGEGVRRADQSELQERMRNMTPQERQAMGIDGNRGTQGAGDGRGNAQRERSRNEHHASRDGGHGGGAGGGYGRGGGGGRNR